MVFNLCLNYLQNTNDAEEVTQDVFVKVYKLFDSFKEQSSVKTWIYRIAINQCLDFLKAKKRQKRFGIHIPIWGNSQESVYPTPSDFNHPGVLLEDKEALKQLFRHINSLPHNQKTALILKAIEGLSQKEIAAILDVSIKSVESLLSRAKDNLRKKIDSSEG
ncbi:MAG: RNA polymerase sigma factor (sigma-70 family) [Saprospiraceae bacterium]|jgi:RNA polymerase sigma factor (sigma-70 family)